MRVITTKQLDTQIKTLRTRIANAIPFKEAESMGIIKKFKRTPYTISYQMLEDCEKFIHSFQEEGWIMIDEKCLRIAKKKLFEKLVKEYS